MRWRLAIVLSFLSLGAQAHICELKLLIRNGVALKITLGEKPSLTLEKIEAAETAPKGAAGGFFNRLVRVAEGLGDMARLQAISGAITQIRREGRPENHAELMRAMAAHFKNEGIANVKVQKHEGSGAYTYLFAPLGPEVSSPSRWYGDLQAFFQQAEPKNPTIAYISSHDGLDATSQFHRDFRTGATRLSLSDFPTSIADLYPSPNTAHELFHWLNDWMIMRGHTMAAWPQHRIQLGQDELVALDPKLLTLSPTPLIHEARRTILQHYVKPGFLIEEVGAYAFQSWLEGALTEELARDLSLAKDVGGLQALARRGEFQSRGLMQLAFETLRKYDFHLAFAEVALVAYMTFIKQAEKGFSIERTEDQLLTLELRDGTKIDMYFKEGAREREALYRRDPPKLIAELMIAVAKIVDESQRLQADLPRLARQILPVLEFYLTVHEDQPLQGVRGAQGEEIRLADFVGFAREKAGAMPASEARAEGPLYTFPRWIPKN